MVAKSILLLAVAAIAQARVARRQDGAANIVYDGRVKESATKADFDTTTGPFGKDFVKGQSQCFNHAVLYFDF